MSPNANPPTPGYRISIYRHLLRAIAEQAGTSSSTTPAPPADGSVADAAVPAPLSPERLRLAVR